MSEIAGEANVESVRTWAGNWNSVMTKLKVLAEKQLGREESTPEEELWMKVFFFVFILFFEFFVYIYVCSFRPPL